MATTTPVIRQVSWLVALPSLLILTFAVLVGWLLDGSRGLMIAVICYLAWSIGSRTIVPHDHRTGLSLVRQKEFEKAIEHFERSYAFFDRHRWLDDWRGLFLLSSSRASYREMAMLNIAFCHAQLGNGDQAAQTYQRCLELFPDSGVAQAALRLLKAGASISRT